MEKEIKTSMERIVYEEKFIKEETSQIDQCLKRCKTLANMMVTMKKLAMVQDPSLSASRSERSGRSLFTVNENGFTANNKSRINGLMNGKSTSSSTGQLSRSERSETAPPPVPPAPTNYEGSSSSSKGNTDANVLDTILDELTNTVRRDRQSKSKSPSSTRSESAIRNGPPKPPERYSTVDVRNRFTPSEVQEIQRRVIECVSPTPG
ncbi:unnamed protein product [Gongylonema pulchrum]|uniref:Uncharacterized protein n=1 Tax=Gongylonema pulchrum TaxID=637853 RepID=A0A3P6Q199_9BILA|nr:unnamed protein product [Gongylonema pulchrum]